MRLERLFYRPRLGYFAALLGLCLGGSAAWAEDRLWMEGTINGKGVRLMFDTGAEGLVLFPKAVARLGLAYTNAPENVAPGARKVLLGMTEECDLKVNGTPGVSVRARFLVAALPAMLHVPADGVVGWSAIGNPIVLIDAERRVARPLESIPAEATNWSRLKVLTNSGVLRLELAQAGGGARTVLVDTGSEYGVSLSAEQWQEWKAAHTNQPLTLAAYYSPNAGLVVKEECWARRLAIGDLVLKDVPVKEGDQTDRLLGSVTFGFAALERLDVVVDVKGGFAWLHAKATPPAPYEHNRLGAVFTPVDLEREELLARVVPGSPGWEAGIRNGDELRRIDELDVTKWRTDPAVLPLSRFWARPAGSKLELTLKRGREVFKARVVLREILPPERGS